MNGWRILAVDHGNNAGQTWMSRVYGRLEDALLEAAWMQQRDALLGYDGAFTVVEVEV